MAKASADVTDGAGLFSGGRWLAGGADDEGRAGSERAEQDEDAEASEDKEEGVLLVRVSAETAIPVAQLLAAGGAAC